MAIYCGGLAAISRLPDACALTRLGYTGVTSNDILSRAERNATGLLFSISTRSLQGSILMRLPSGRAGICAMFFASGLGDWASAASRIGLPDASLLPK